MFEAAVGEGFEREGSPMNLAGRRSQLERYRSRWDRFSEAAPETVAIPEFKVRICEKGCIAYVFQNESNAALCVQVIQLPSTCNGVTRGEWVLHLDMLSPDAMVRGMTLQPELNLLVVIVYVPSGGRGYVLAFSFVAIIPTILRFRALKTYTLRLSDGQPHPACPTPGAFYTELGPGSVYTRLCVTKSRLALLIKPTEMRDSYWDTVRVYELRTGQVILVRFIQFRSPRML